MSVRVGRISDVEVRLHYSWFVVFGLITWSLAVGYLPSEYPDQLSNFYWTVGVIAAVSLFLSVFVHEFLHTVVAKRSRVEVRSITLHFFGGVSEVTMEAPGPGVELRMAIAGPLTSLVLGLALLGGWLLVPPQTALGASATLKYASYINLSLAAFNMIPAFPMDGGRVLRAIIWRRSGNLLGSTRRAVQISHFLSYLLMAIGLFSFLFDSLFSGLWILVIALFIKNSADASLHETMIVEALKDVRVGEIMTREVHTVEPSAPIKQLVDEHFVKYKHRGFPVVAGGEMVGLVTDHDIRQVPRDRWGEVMVGDVMKPAGELETVKPEDTASDALLQMSRRDVGRLPVLEEGRLVGIVTRSDITRTIRTRLQFSS